MLIKIIETYQKASKCKTNQLQGVAQSAGNSTMICDAVSKDHKGQNGKTTKAKTWLVRSAGRHGRRAGTNGGPS